jgi:hypothetical protein
MPGARERPYAQFNVLVNAGTGTPLDGLVEAPIPRAHTRTREIPGADRPPPASVT